MGKQEETKAASLAESVYATLQTGFNAVSNLNLKSEAAKHDEDLKSYLPEEDEANQYILESAINSSIKDPMQAHKLDQEEVADSSLEYASLLPVCGDLMPDDDEDELDHGLGDVHMQLQQQSHKDPEEDEEFLPSTEVVSSQSKSLARLEDDDEDEDDEFTASLMAAAAKDVAQVEQEEESPSTAAIRHPRKVSPEMDDNLEDFEMISESELAEVSP